MARMQRANAMVLEFISSPQDQEGGFQGYLVNDKCFIDFTESRINVSGHVIAEFGRMALPGV
jgi:hypothetical protein